MTPDQLSELIAKAPRVGDWVVVKIEGELLFYRPESRGYTSSLLAAGTFPKAEAEDIAKNASCVLAAQVGSDEGFQRLLQRVGYHGLSELAAIQELGRLRKALLGLKRGDCWCEMAIDNPMVAEHDRSCLEARKLMGQEGGE